MIAYFLATCDCGFTRAFKKSDSASRALRRHACESYAERLEWEEEIAWRNRRIVALYTDAGLTSRRVAEVVGVSLSTVQSVLRYHGVQRRRGRRAGQVAA